MAMKHTSIKRVVFVISNLIFFILGLAVLGVGIYSRVEDGNWKDIVSITALLQAANILIAAGVFVALIGLLGCFGAWKGSANCLIAYGFLVLSIFVLEIAAGIYAYTHKKEVQKKFEEGVDKAVKISYGKTDTAATGLTKAVDWFQKTVKCCGSADPTDWRTSHWFKSVAKNDTIVPSSCCVEVTNGCNQGKSVASLGNRIYTKGCIKQGKKFAMENLLITGAVGIGIGIVELLGIVCAIMLCREIKQEKYETV